MALRKECRMCSKACSEALGAQTLMRDLGKDCAVTVHLDSSSALSMAQRSGLGKAKHISVQYLWMQELQSAKEIRLRMVKGKNSLACILAKGVRQETLRSCGVRLSPEGVQGLR